MLFTLYALTLIAQLADENNPSDTFRVKLAVFSLIYVLFYLIFVVGWMGRLP